jgi:hypothetical protein
MGRDLKTGIFQRLDQEPAHVVVVFGKEDLVHGEKTNPGFRRTTDVSLSPIDGKYRVKSASRQSVSAKAISGPDYGANQREQAFCGCLRDVPCWRKAFSLGRMVAIIDNEY